MAETPIQSAKATDPHLKLDGVHASRSHREERGTLEVGTDDAAVKASQKVQDGHIHVCVCVCTHSLSLSRACFFACQLRFSCCVCVFRVVRCVLCFFDVPPCTSTGMFPCTARHVPVHCTGMFPCTVLACSLALQRHEESRCAFTLRKMFLAWAGARLTFRGLFQTSTFLSVPVTKTSASLTALLEAEQAPSLRKPAGLVSLLFCFSTLRLAARCDGTRELLRGINFVTEVISV